MEPIGIHPVQLLGCRYAGWCLHLAAQPSPLYTLSTVPVAYLFQFPMGTRNILDSHNSIYLYISLSDSNIYGILCSIIYGDIRLDPATTVLPLHRQSLLYLEPLLVKSRFVFRTGRG